MQCALSLDRHTHTHTQCASNDKTNSIRMKPIAHRFRVIGAVRLHTCSTVHDMFYGHINWFHWLLGNISPLSVIIHVKNTLLCNVIWQQQIDIHCHMENLLSPSEKKRQPRNGAIKYIIISISQTCGININIITNGWEQQQQQQKQICQRNNYNILEWMRGRT